MVVGALLVYTFVSMLNAGQTFQQVLSRVIYTLVGLAAIWCISLLFRGRDEIDGDTEEA